MRVDLLFFLLACFADFTETGTRACRVDGGYRNTFYSKLRIHLDTEWTSGAEASLRTHFLPGQLKNVRSNTAAAVCQIIIQEVSR